MELKPQILIHPHIPKPLHGLNPRSIMGQAWWDITRQKAYASTNYHCVACGIHKLKAKYHQWLEAHEFWDINYRTGVCKVTSIEPLCHSCHNFIHTGRLYMMVESGKIGRKRAIDILEHGFRILSKNKLKCFPFTLDLAYEYECETYDVEAYEIPDKDIKWDKWTLIWEGKEYKSKFRSEEDWADHYSRLNN